MNRDEERALEAQVTAGGEMARAARRELAAGHADDAWQAGDRAGAMQVLYRAGWDVEAIVGFCRDRGLSHDEARDLIRDANIDRR